MECNNALGQNRLLVAYAPYWQLVYYYYRKWVAAEVLDKILDKLRSKARVKQGQKAMAIMDSQTVRWGNNRLLKSYDGNKKVKGIKRHIVIDKNGFLPAVMVKVAHIHDSQCVMMLTRVLRDVFCNIK